MIFLVEKISLKFLLVWNTVFFAALTAYELLCLWLIYSPVKSDYFLLLLYERADYCAFAILMPFLLGLFCRFFVASAIEHKNTKACSFYYFYAFTGMLTFAGACLGLLSAPWRAGVTVLMVAFMAFTILSVLYVFTRLTARFFVKDIKRQESAATRQLFSKYFYVFWLVLFLMFVALATAYPAHDGEMHERQARAAEVLKNIKFRDIQKKLDSNTAFSFEEWKELFLGNANVGLLRKYKDQTDFIHYNFFYNLFNGYRERHVTFPKCGEVEAWGRYLAAGVQTYGVYKKRIYRSGTGRGTVQKGGVIFHKPDGVSFYVVIFWGDPVFTCVGSG